MTVFQKKVLSSLATLVEMLPTSSTAGNNTAVPACAYKPLLKRFKALAEFQLYDQQLKQSEQQQNQLVTLTHLKSIYNTFRKHKFIHKHKLGVRRGYIHIVSYLQFKYCIFI